MQKEAGIGLIYVHSSKGRGERTVVPFDNHYDENNSIEIEVSPQRMSYDYGDNVSLDISITNKNRYAKLYYKISEIYSGGGFSPLNLTNDERIVESNSNANISVILKDNFYKETTEKDIDTHITFNNGYYNGKGKMSIGKNVYEMTEKEFSEFQRYRNEKVGIGETQREPLGKREGEQLEQIKSQINATLLIIFIILLVIVSLVIFIWFIIKSKSKGGYHFKCIIFIIGITLSLILNRTNKVYAADIYQENVKYSKSVSTQVGYANFTCTFDVKIEYYFVNTIAPITDLELDTDSDTLPDYLEVLYLTDLNNDDTDRDGLPDGVEVYRTYTDPLRVDTDNNGVKDSDEDYDKDKLTNIEEKSNGTDYDNIDTDYDNLSDYDEVNGVKSKDGLKTYILNPLSDDTDGDGLRDDTEIKLWLDPTNPSDAHIKVRQEINQSVLPKDLTIESSTPISFYGELVGDIDENVRARKSSNSLFDNMQYTIGNAVIIDTSYDYNSGLKMSFDLSKYKGIKDRILVYRNENGELKEVEHTFVSGNKLNSDCYSGEYVLIDSKKYMQDINIFIK